MKLKVVKLVKHALAKPATVIASFVIGGIVYGVVIATKSILEPYGIAVPIEPVTSTLFSVLAGYGIFDKGVIPLFKQGVKDSTASEHDTASAWKLF